MLEQLIYKNHVNEVFEFGKDGIFVDMNDLHDYEWTVTKKGNRIAALDYGISKRKLPVTIICDTEAKGIAARNKLLEVVEKDVLALQHGQVIIGDYYFKCFVTKSQKKNYLTTKRWMEMAPSRPAAMASMANFGPVRQSPPTKMSFSAVWKNVSIPGSFSEISFV